MHLLIFWIALAKIKKLMTKNSEKKHSKRNELDKNYPYYMMFMITLQFQVKLFFLWDSSDVRLKYMNFIWCQIFYSFFTLFLNDAKENFVLFKTCPFSGWWSVVLLNDSKSDLVFLMHVVPCVCSLFIALSFQ